MLFYEIGPKPDAAGRYYFFACVDYDVEAMTESALNRRHQKLHVPRDLVGERHRFVAGTVRAEDFLTQHVDVIAGRVPVLAHDPASGAWRLALDLDAVRAVRRAQLKANFNHYILRLFPEWKQLNYTRDLADGLITAAVLGDQQRVQAHLILTVRAKAKGWLPAWEIFKQARAKTLPIEAESLKPWKRELWPALEAGAAFQLIDRLRGQCAKLEAELDALTTPDEVYRFSPESDSLFPEFLDCPWP